MRIIICLLIFLTGFCNLNREIFHADEIHDIKSEITPDTLILFNVAEVLMDTESSLGTQAWRKFIRSRTDAKTHDELTWIVFENFPPKSPETTTPELIQELQSNGYTTFGFTSRGRNEWYSSQVLDVDLKTEQLLLQIGIDFSKTTLNNELSMLPELFGEYFHNGIIYAGNSQNKGELLKQIIETTGYLPSKVIYVDDKEDSLKEVEKAVESINIPFVGYVYSKTAQNHQNFDPQIANIELWWFLRYDTILTDQDAEQIKANGEVESDPETFLQKIVGFWWFLQRLSEPVGPAIPAT
jgi:hypothetical protein